MNRTRTVKTLMSRKARLHGILCKILKPMGNKSELFTTHHNTYYLFRLHGDNFFSFGECSAFRSIIFVAFRFEYYLCEIEPLGTPPISPHMGKKKSLHLNSMRVCFSSQFWRWYDKLMIRFFLVSR